MVPDKDSLALALGQTHMTYAQRFNHTGRRSRHLWKNRFYSCPVGSTHLTEVLLYVDLNPVRARIIERAADYPWSSANTHTSHNDPSGLLDKWEWSGLDEHHEWRDRLEHADHDRRASRELRRAVRGGRPYGSPEFVEMFDRRLRGVAEMAVGSSAS